MTAKLTAFLAFGLLLCFFSCRKKHSDTPELSFSEISKSFMTQNGSDSLFLTFRFIDGDGDIGSDTSKNIVVTDNRNGSILATYKVPDYFPDNSNNRQGSITLVVYAPCCIYPNGTSCQPSTAYPTDTMRYEIQMKDRAGNESNLIQSDLVTLECN
jgi:hypothetical protein